MADEPTTKAARYMMETTSQVTARVCRPDGTSVGVIDVQKAAAYRDELNTLLNQLEEARAEAERLRGLLRPIAEVFVEESARQACRRRDHSAYDRAFLGKAVVTWGHMRQCCAALGIVIDRPTRDEAPPEGGGSDG